MYSVFGKNKNSEEQAKVKNELSEEKMYSPATDSRLSEKPIPVTISCSVDEDAVPF